MKSLARILAVFLVLGMVVRPATAASEYEEHVYAVTINGESVSTGTIVLQAADGTLLVAGDDLARWRLLLTSRAPRTAFDGRPYFALNDFPGLITKVDETRQVLEIQAPADLFSANTIDSSLVNAAGRVINRDRGAFLNYDIFSSRIGSTALTDGLLEGGISSAHGGVLTSSVGWQPNFAGEHFTRLNTTWQRDYVSARRTVRIGDAVSSPGRLGGSANFAGVQYSSDFSTDPEFQTSPGLDIRGIAPTSSTVDVLVNNANYVSQQRVAAGPFVLDTAPLLLNGQGEVRVIVHDALGGEHVIVQPFYQARDLLRPGLDEFSYEAGFLRNRFGAVSNSYGKPVAAGTIRHGFTNHFTGEAHVEATPGLELADLSGDVTMARLGLVSAGVATSVSSAGTGFRALLGYQYQGLHHFGIAGTVTTASSNFRSIGTTFVGGQSAQLQVIVPVRRASMAIGILEEHSPGGRTLGLASLGFSGRVGDGYFNVSASQGLAGTSSSFFAGYTGRFGPRTISMQGSSLGGATRVTTDIATDLPASGYGSSYDVALNSGSGGSKMGGGYRLETPLFHLDARTDAGYSYANLRGGMTFVDGKLFPTREISSSYGVAIVPGYPNVRVYVNGLEAGRTDKNGIVPLAYLVPYVPNRVSVEKRDLPIAANFARFDEVTVPYIRSATVVRFTTGTSGGIVIHARRPDGTSLPAGSVIFAPTGPDTYPVGDDGLAYLPGLHAGGVKLKANVGGDGKCEITLTVPADTSEIPDLGNVVCAGAASATAPVAIPAGSPRAVVVPTIQKIGAAGGAPKQSPIVAASKAPAAQTSSGSPAASRAQDGGGVVARLEYADGTPVPAGALLFAPNGAPLLPVRPGGLIYLPVLSDAHTRLVAKIEDKTGCSASFVIPDDLTRQAVVGTVVCNSATTTARQAPSPQPAPPPVSAGRAAMLTPSSTVAPGAFVAPASPRDSEDSAAARAVPDPKAAPAPIAGAHAAPSSSNVDFTADKPKSFRMSISHEERAASEPLIQGSETLRVIGHVRAKRRHIAFQSRPKSVARAQKRPSMVRFRWLTRH